MLDMALPGIKMQVCYSLEAIEQEDMMLMMMMITTTMTALTTAISMMMVTMRKNLSCFLYSKPSTLNES